MLGRAQRLCPIRICCLSVLSSHVHLLVHVNHARQLADFMEYACSNLAREVGRLTDWEGSVFAGRYHAIIVSPEEQTQVARLAYCLAQGCKENLVERVLDWPGVHAAQALLDGKPLTGYWFDRSQEYKGAPPGGELRPLPLCHAGNRPSLAAPLLEGSLG